MVVIFATLGLPICAGRRSARTDWLSLEPSVVTRYRLFGGEPCQLRSPSDHLSQACVCSSVRVSRAVPLNQIEPDINPLLAAVPVFNTIDKHRGRERPDTGAVHAHRR
jgi:hypothetical protein